MSGINGVNGVSGTNGSGLDHLATAHLSWADPAHNELEAEQNRLRRELAEATARLSEARRKLAARDESLHEALREELELAQRALADREESHRRAVEDVLAAARLDAERIIEAAKYGEFEMPIDVTEQVEHGQ